MNDEHLYEKVIEELQRVGPKPGLWAKAFAESEGQEPMAKALYIRYRAEQLAEIERHTNAEKKKQEAEISRVASVKSKEKVQFRAKENGLTAMHLVLGFLCLLIVALLSLRIGKII